MARTNAAGKSKSDESKWNLMFNALKEYKRRFHHCTPPRTWEGDYTKLSAWVQQQRHRFKNGILKQERQIKLTAIGFLRQISTVDGKWFAQYNKLVEFHRLHGHCDVESVGSPSDPVFFKWLNLQRENTKYGLVREDHKYLLDKLGHNWDSTSGVVATQPKDSAPMVNKGVTNHDPAVASSFARECPPEEVTWVVDGISQGDDEPVSTATVYEAVASYVNKSKSNKRKRMLFAKASRKQVRSNQVSSNPAKTTSPPNLAGLHQLSTNMLLDPTPTRQERTVRLSDSKTTPSSGNGMAWGKAQRSLFHQRDPDGFHADEIMPTLHEKKTD